MHIKPIPRRMLPDSVVYKPLLENGRNGSVWGDEVMLKFVCVDYNTKYAIKGDNQGVAYKAMLFYDCRNSRPIGIAFREKDKIIHNGKEMTVESVSIPNSGDRIHHYELGLV